MVGQNAGAGAMDRVRKITRTGLWCGLASTLILLLLVHRFSLPILQLFGSDSPEVLSAGVLYFQICCGVNSLFYTAMYLFDSFAIGLGHAKVALVNCPFGQLPAAPACLLVSGFPPRLGLSRSVDRAGHLSPAPRPHRGMVLPPHRWKLPHPPWIRQADTWPVSSHCTRDLTKKPCQTGFFPVY